jgi:hypothetical protein
MTTSTLTRWGSWRLSGHHLISKAGGYEYAIDLHDCTTSAQALDWVCQIATKKWGTPDVVGDLAHAINDVLAPQANLCSSGMDKRLTPAQIKKLLIAYRHRARGRAR